MEQIIPISDSYLIKDSTSRYRGAEWFKKASESNIIVAGLGGIGSFFTFLLSRINPYSIRVFDDDVVDESNMSGQFYSTHQNGTNKVYAIRESVVSFSRYFNLWTHSNKYNEHISSVSNIMICGFDNMKARKIFYYKWKNNINKDSSKEYLFIDGRLAFEKLQVFCITGDDTYSMEKYEKEWLFSDKEADATVCSRKQTTYMSAMIGSLMTNLLVNFFTNNSENKPLIARDLPFLTTYDAEMMMLNTYR